MSYDEIIYRIDKFPSIDTDCIHIKDYDCSNYNIDETLKPKKKFVTKIRYKEKKTVRFPEECKIVSDYFEVENYWQERRFCSSAELLTSYKKACEFYNIKPIPSLLEQISGIDVSLNNDRFDTLNLSNIKLDLKHVECIEEVLKRVQFITLNFSNTTLDDNAAVSLFEIIEYYESCLKLNISLNCKMSYVGFNALSKMLKKILCLQTLELRGIYFIDSTMPSLNKALRGDSYLRVLHLENSNITSKNLLILTSALKLNFHLRELHLSGNRMVPADGIQLGSLLRVNTLLETLDLRNNFLGDVGLSHISDGLFDQTRVLSNRIDKENQGSGLLCLILWNNYITFDGMPYLSRGLKGTKSLQSLNIGKNNIASEGAYILREGLLLNRSLLKLSLPSCKITCEGGVAIAEYIADTKNLIRLDIRNNDIKTAGLMAISLSMKVNKSVTRLDVDAQPKKDPNVNEFFETQSESLNIIQKQLEENKRIALEIEELKLSQSVINLSNAAQNALDVLSDRNSFLFDQEGSTESTSVTSTKPEEVPQTINDTDSTDCVLENNIDKSESTMSFDLSLDTDVSDLLINNFYNRVISPTDIMLERDDDQSYFDGNGELVNQEKEVRVEEYQDVVDDFFDMTEPVLHNTAEHEDNNLSPNQFSIYYPSLDNIPIEDVLQL